MTTPKKYVITYRGLRARVKGEAKDKEKDGKGEDTIMTRTENALKNNSSLLAGTVEVRPADELTLTAAKILREEKNDPLSHGSSGFLNSLGIDEFREAASGNINRLSDFIMKLHYYEQHKRTIYGCFLGTELIAVVTLAKFGEDLAIEMETLEKAANESECDKLLAMANESLRAFLVRYFITDDEGEREPRLVYPMLSRDDLAGTVCRTNGGVREMSGNVVEDRFIATYVFTRETVLATIAGNAAVNNHSEITRSEQCGCFFCLETFPASDVEEWLSSERVGDTDGSAVCPCCGTDAVIGDASGLPVNGEFLAAVRRRWFDI